MVHNNSYPRNHKFLRPICPKGHDKRLTGLTGNTGCRVCERIRSRNNYHRLYVEKKYGITFQQYQELVKKQNSCCAICGVSQSKLTKKLAIDHDHKTLKVRGLLCARCNFGVSIVEDSLFQINAINYLKYADTLTKSISN